MMYAGIWGAGNIANSHAAALLNAGVKIKAVVDKNREQAKAFAEKWEVENFGTDESILFDPKIESVHVCTPPNLHFEMVSKLLIAGKNVLCEKPLCFDNEEADTLVKLAKENHCICAINLNVRYHMASKKAKTLVGNSEFGRVNLIHGTYLQEFNAFPAPRDWRYNPVLAGKMRAVTEIGTHWLDIIQYISRQKIEAVSATFGNFYPERDLIDEMMYPKSNDDTEKIEVISEDVALIQMRFENGAIGSVTLSEVSQGRINHLSYEITGEKQSVWWNSEDNNMLYSAEKGRGVHKEVFGFGNGFDDTFRELVREYYIAIKEHEFAELIFPTFDDGANIVKLCNAVYDSAISDSKWIKI